MWCFSTAQHVDLCTSTRDLCATWSDGMNGIGCTPAPEAACFYVRTKGATKDTGVCLRTADTCKQMMLTWNDGSGDRVTTGCVIFRRGAAR